MQVSIRGFILNHSACVCVLQYKYSWYSFENRSLTEEDEDGTKPLHSADDVPKQQHRPQDGEELPRRCDDGTSERPKIHHSHEDESLGEERGGE